MVETLRLRKEESSRWARHLVPSDFSVDVLGYGSCSTQISKVLFNYGFLEPVCDFPLDEYLQDWIWKALQVSSINSKIKACPIIDLRLGFA